MTDLDFTVSTKGDDLVRNIINEFPNKSQNYCLTPGDVFHILTNIRDRMVTEQMYDEMIGMLDNILECLCLFDARFEVIKNQVPYKVLPKITPTLTQQLNSAMSGLTQSMNALDKASPFLQTSLQPDVLKRFFEVSEGVADEGKL